MRMLTGLMRTSPRPEDEFRDLIARRGARMQAACLRITRDPALAEDAVQDALLKAWRARDQFRGEAERDTWLHRIAINAALELVRRRGPMADVDVDAPEHDAPGGDELEQRPRAFESLEAHEQCLSGLPRCRRARAHDEKIVRNPPP